MPKLVRRSSARLSPYLRGVIFGMSKAGRSTAYIQRAIKMPDGVQPSHQAVADAIALCKRQGGVKWDGVVKTDQVGRQRSENALSLAEILTRTGKRYSRIFTVGAVAPKTHV